jgi:hypothetical protein
LDEDTAQPDTNKLLNQIHGADRRQAGRMKLFTPCVRDEGFSDEQVLGVLGSVRISFGAASTWQDVNVLVDFIKSCFIETNSMLQQPLYKVRLAFPLMSNPSDSAL